MAATGSASALSVFNFASPHCKRFFVNVTPSSNFEKRFAFTCFASKKKRLSFVDQILDYIEGSRTLFMYIFLADVTGRFHALSLLGFALSLARGLRCTGFLNLNISVGRGYGVSFYPGITWGPKLRKWYGAPDLLQNDEDELEEDDTSVEEEVRDAVLVTDGDNDVGQMIILSLILKRVRVKAVVKDKRAAMEAFGTYVESLAGDANDRTFLKKALSGAFAVICPTEGFLSNIDNWKGIQHVILLSQLSVYRDSTGIQAVMNSNARKLAEQDENVVKTSGVPYSIIRTGVLKNTPGGQQGFSFKEGCAAKGSLSKEDAARVCVEALENIPQKGLKFEVVNGEEKVSDWKKCFATLMNGSAE